MIDALNRRDAHAERQGGLQRRASPSAGWLAGAAVLGNLSLAPHLQSALAPWTDSISRSPPAGALEAPEIWGALLAAGLACWAIPAVSTLRSCQSLEERLEALGRQVLRLATFSLPLLAVQVIAWKVYEVTLRVSLIRFSG